MVPTRHLKRASAETKKTPFSVCLQRPQADGEAASVCLLRRARSAWLRERIDAVGLTYSLDNNGNISPTRRSLNLATESSLASCYGLVFRMSKSLGSSSWFIT
jgi:hypothetical protein